MVCLPAIILKVECAYEDEWPFDGAGRDCLLSRRDCGGEDRCEREARQPIRQFSDLVKSWGHGGTGAQWKGSEAVRRCAAAADESAVWSTDHKHGSRFAKMRAYVRTRAIALYWLELTAKLMAPGGRTAKRDRDAFEADCAPMICA